MASLIRTRTFLKYAQSHLEEAEHALAGGRYGDVATRCSDAAIALAKAVSATLMRPAGEGPPEGKALLSLIAELCFDREEAKRLAGDIDSLVHAGRAEPGREDAARLTALGKTLLDDVRRLCLS